MQPFHLAIPVDDLDRAEWFYGSVLACSKGRQSSEWIDFDFFGHQLVVHLAPGECGKAETTGVDGEQVPVRHFGAVLSNSEWHHTADQLKEAGIDFIIEPTLRNKGKPGEQGTFFVADPSGNALEFKWFADSNALFAS